MLTADSILWDTAKEFVGKEDIDFESIHLKSGSENAYALYCAAKDLYNGSRHLDIDDKLFYNIVDSIVNKFLALFSSFL